MKSAVEMPEEMIRRFDEYMEEHDLNNGIRPERFIKIKKTHISLADFDHRDEPLFIQNRNPVIAVLGDSVSCGYFEEIDKSKLLLVSDPTVCYMELVKQQLQEIYPLTCVTLINSAIAGDNIKSMEDRLTRDIISHQPDLVVLNASLNWSVRRGTFEDFKRSYRKVIERILRETDAELIILTPNVSIYEDLIPRVEVVRSLAEEYKLPMIDIHKMYTEVLKPEEYENALANRENHPTVYGHKLYARAIMKILEEK